MYVNLEKKARGKRQEYFTPRRLGPLGPDVDPRDIAYADPAELGLTVSPQAQTGFFDMSYDHPIAGEVAHVSRRE